MAEFKFKMTLIANGNASGPAYVTVEPGDGYVVVDFAPSGARPFQNAAWPWRVQVFKTTVVGNTLCGYMTVCDANNLPVMTHVPFCAYIGDVWPQAPVGIVHAVKPFHYDDGHMLFSVIIEKA